MRVGVGSFASSWKAERIRPGVLAVVSHARAGTGAITDFGVTTVLINVENLIEVIRCLIGNFQNPPSLGVGEYRVLIDHRVQRAAQIGTGTGGIDACVVVPNSKSTH